MKTTNPITNSSTEIEESSVGRVPSRPQGRDQELCIKTQDLWQNKVSAAFPVRCCAPDQAHEVSYHRLLRLHVWRIADMVQHSERNIVADSQWCTIPLCSVSWFCSGRDCLTDICQVPW